jgi:phospholipid/cholesterol/gamma-HCH transport system ATP-binding protein
MIELQSVVKYFGDFNVLKGISFSIQAGSSVTLLGPGGSGKTTILKLILGLIEADSGTVKLMGQALRDLDEEQRMKRLTRVGMAFQQGALFDFMTVADNLSFAMTHMTDFDQEKMDRRIDELLKAVKLPRTRAMYPFELSGGMQRRIGIARALCTDPEVAIFDEPTSGLDPVTSTIVLNMIHDLGNAATNRTLLMATTSVEVAMRFSERIILIHEGRVVADGSWRRLLTHGDAWTQHFLGARLVGLAPEYARELSLPEEFIEKHCS